MANLLYESARKNRSNSNVAGWAASGASILGLGLMFSGVNQAINDGNNDRAMRRGAAGFGLILASAVTNLAVTLPLKLRSERQMSEAVFLRNQAILFGQ